MHCGASPEGAAGTGAKRVKKSPATPSSQRTRLISTRGSHRLQYDLLVISAPHGLIEIAQRAVIFLFQEGKAASEMPFHMEQAFVIFYLQSVPNAFLIVFLPLCKTSSRPTTGQ